MAPTSEQARSKSQTLRGNIISFTKQFSLQCLGVWKNHTLIEVWRRGQRYDGCYTTTDFHPAASADMWYGPTWFLGALSFATVLQPCLTPNSVAQEKLGLRRIALWLTSGFLRQKLDCCHGTNAGRLHESALSPKAFANLALFQRDVLQSRVGCSCVHARNSCMQTGDIRWSWRRTTKNWQWSHRSCSGL